jgi:hypothetical protein
MYFQNFWFFFIGTKKVRVSVWSAGIQLVSRVSRFDFTLTQAISVSLWYLLRSVHALSTISRCKVPKRGCAHEQLWDDGFIRLYRNFLSLCQWEHPYFTHISLYMNHRQSVRHINPTATMLRFWGSKNPWRLCSAWLGCSCDCVFHHGRCQRPIATFVFSGCRSALHTIFTHGAL